MSEEFLTYKGFPLVRKGNQIYYGSMGDDYVAQIQIVSSHKEKEIEVSDKLKVFLLRTAKDIDPKDMVVKSSEWETLYDALDVANIWLNKAITE